MTIYFDIAVMIASGVAAVIDLKSRKIPNWLTLNVAAAGIIGGLFAFGWEGLLFATKGWIVGLCIFMLPFFLGGMGGGDVKFMGAIGALKGVSFVLETALFGALWGGLLATITILVNKRTYILKRFGFGLRLFILTRGQVGKVLMLPEENTDDQQKKLYVPYGVAIFLGVLTSYIVDLKLPL